MLHRLEELCNLCGVSGQEGPVRKYIKEAITPLCDEVWTDTMGNLYAHKSGNGPRVMVAAHMDEVGMLVAGFTDSGLIQYVQRGIDPRVSVSKRVVVGKDLIPGIIGAKAIHLQSSAEFSKALPHDSLYVDIGAKDKADAEKSVKKGDFICFDVKFSRFGEGMVRSKALDDRVGCAMVMELLKNSYDCDFYGVFTVQEEVGLRGANAAAYNVKPDVALILEGTTANDMPEVEHGFVTKAGEGPAITFMDTGTIVRAPMFNALKAAAEEAGIPYQLRRGNTGGTDAGIIHKACSGAFVGGISVPCRYIHSPNSVASISDIENAYRLADAFLKTKKFTEVLSHVV